MLTIKGNVITIDAIGCQKEIVKQIREEESEYVIALKGNQGTLHAEAENFFQLKQTRQKSWGCLTKESWLGPRVPPQDLRGQVIFLAISLHNKAYELLN